MRSLTPAYLSKLSFTVKQLATIQRLGEARGRQDLFVAQSPQQLEGLRQAAVIESSESSSRIEGIVAEPGRVEAIVLKSSEPRDRSEQEIAGYRDALDLIHESHEHMPMAVNVVLQLHAMLFRYLPVEGGRWKLAENEIVERAPDGTVARIRFKPTLAAETPQAMELLVTHHQETTDTGTVDPLILAPLTILDFLCIHPFTDGNGRVARLLTLLLLYRANYRAGRYISLERIIEESKETYYEALEKSSQGWHQAEHDATPWLEYFWGVMIRAYDEFEDRVGTILSGRGSKTEQITKAVAARLAPFSVSDVEADCPGVSRDMVRHVLRQMRDDGKIEVRGRGRSARWHRKEI